jgi:hypothetical protein
MQAYLLPTIIQRGRRRPVLSIAGCVSRKHRALPGEPLFASRIVITERRKPVRGASEGSDALANRT